MQKVCLDTRLTDRYEVPRIITGSGQAASRPLSIQVESGERRIWVWGILCVVHCQRPVMGKMDEDVRAFVQQSGLDPRRFQRAKPVQVCSVCWCAVCCVQSTGIVGVLSIVTRAHPGNRPSTSPPSAVRHPKQGERCQGSCGREFSRLAGDLSRTSGLEGHGDGYGLRRVQSAQYRFGEDRDGNRKGEADATVSYSVTVRSEFGRSGQRPTFNTRRNQDQLGSIPKMRLTRLGIR